ncbi:hypothetical protein N0O92_06260 [Alkalihalobacillus sp. MEB130]|uniref:hypothetical protein n=1 Tax=Alkalihalobacillus sp. MEB130 TaxID=2976704 RepID=UPI0028DD8DA1|nr:hypothetical protein [Alkalihalobacillus sp. MEB130]MDT8859831.1 hypothetical protein [Alkalihalobacillus sp. MEB130]
MLKGINETTSKRNTLIITDINHEFQQLLSTFLQVDESNLLVLTSESAAITQPYGCLVRNIILAIYQHNVEHICLIAPKNHNRVKFNQSIMMRELEEDGISQQLLNTLDYSRIVNKDVLSWLKGIDGEVEETLRSSLHLLQNHPLIPNRIVIEAYTMNIETGHFNCISQHNQEEEIG